MSVFLSIFISSTTVCGVRSWSTKSRTLHGPADEITCVSIESYFPDPAGEGFGGKWVKLTIVYADPGKNRVRKRFM
ncbi:hypothetical protein DFH05DRAFT_1472343, partial [Lentinula detonsa]